MHNDPQPKSTSQIVQTDIIKLFKSMRLFSDFKPFRIPIVISQMTKEVYPASYSLVSQGDPISKISIVTKGSFTLQYSYSKTNEVDFTIDHFIPYQSFTRQSFSCIRGHEIKGKQSYAQCDKVLIYSPKDIIGDIEWLTGSQTAFFSIVANEEGSEVYSSSQRGFIEMIETFHTVLREMTKEKMKVIQQRIGTMMRNRERCMITKEKILHMKLADQTRVFERMYRIEKDKDKDEDKVEEDIEERNRRLLLRLRLSSKTRNGLGKNRSCYISRKAKDVPLNKTVVKQFKVYPGSSSNLLSDRVIGDKNNRNKWLDNVNKQLHFDKLNLEKSFLTNDVNHIPLTQRHRQRSQHIHYTSHQHTHYQHKSNFNNKSQSTPHMNPISNPNGKGNGNDNEDSTNDKQRDPIEPVFFEYKKKIQANLKSNLFRNQIVKEHPSYINLSKTYRHKLYPNKGRSFITFKDKDLIIDKAKSRQFVVQMNNYFKYTSQFYYNNNNNKGKGNNYNSNCNSVNRKNYNSL